MHIDHAFGIGDDIRQRERQDEMSRLPARTFRFGEFVLDVTAYELREVGQSKSPGEIGRELDVDYILEGVIRVANGLCESRLS